MRKHIRNFLLYIVFACSYQQGLSNNKPTFYIEHKEARMPVVIRGKVESQTLVIFLHGGPGGTSMKKIGTRAFNALEKDFGIVYWDQRGAHGSHGGASRKHLNLEQFVEDLDQIVTALNMRFPQSQIFLMGHCWGGALGTAYLADPIRQRKITGWIEVAGSHNNPRGDSLSAEWVKSFAKKMIESGESVNYWKKSLKWYRKHPKFSSSALSHYSFVRKANGYQFAHGDSLGTYPGFQVRDLIRTPIVWVRYYLNYYRSLAAFEISSIDLSPSLEKIHIPSLILWGKDDGLVPTTIGIETFRDLGTATENKRLVVMENAAHTLYYEQPTRFASEVKEFVRTHKKPLIEDVLAKSVRQ